jgi:hypothetical protein
MKTYIYIKENFEAVSCGTDTLIHIDGRLNNSNKAAYARFWASKRANIGQAYAIALFDPYYYDSKTGKYYYKNGLIKL